MLDTLISAAFAGLAIIGGFALGVRLFRSTGRVVLSSAELAAATGVAEASARRGDLTRMQEGRRVASEVRKVRARAAQTALLWLFWLVIPLAFELLPTGYAIAAPLWLFRGRPMRAGIPDR